MIQRLARYVSIKSLSREEGALADLVAGDLCAAGLRVQRDGANVWAEIGDAPRPRLLFNSHLDTVPPGAGWTADPWTPRRVNGRLIALGANDAKGCVVAMLEAALATQGDLDGGGALNGTLVLALTAEEEISGQGLETILERLAPLDGALVGEPTALVPMTAQRGLLTLRGVAHGRSAHPANTPPETAENAVQLAAREVRRLADFDWGPEHPLLGRPHGNVTRIAGGVANNVIPDSCEFVIDVRTTPAEPHAALTERLRAFLDCELLAHSDRLGPIETPADTGIVQAVLRAAPGARPQGSPAMSDMVFLRGIPAVKIGPGDSPRSHTADEYLLESELHAGAALYQRIAREFFSAASASERNRAASASERNGTASASERQPASDGSASGPAPQTPAPQSRQLQRRQRPSDTSTCERPAPPEVPQ